MKDKTFAGVYIHIIKVLIMHIILNLMIIIIDALNETNPGMHISEDAIIQIELAFRKMRELLLCKNIISFSYEGKQ